MRFVIIISIAFVLLISLGGSNLIQQSYADLDPETIELDILELRIIESDKSDVIILKISFLNNGKFEAYITTDYVYFVDSQERLFHPAWFRDLQENGFSLTIEDCPINSGPTLNAGLTTEEINCYEVPKGIGDSFSLLHYSTLIGLCEFVECTTKSFPFIMAQPFEPLNSTSKIPEWVRNIFIWYAENQISEDELLNAIQFLLDQGILKSKS